MKDSWSNSARSGIWGLLLGSAIGFLLGILFAPQEGKRVRRKVAYQLDNLGEKVADLVESALSDVDEGSPARKAANDLVKDAKEKADVIRNDIDALLGEMRQQRSDS